MAFKPTASLSWKPEENIWRIGTFSINTKMSRFHLPGPFPHSFLSLLYLFNERLTQENKNTKEQCVKGHLGKINCSHPLCVARSLAWRNFFFICEHLAVGWN